MKNFKIRNFTVADRDIVRNLCCDTGFLGNPIDPVFEDRGAGLHDLVPSGRRAGEAEAIGSDDRAVLQDDIVAQATMLPHDGMRVSDKSIAYNHMWV